MKNKKLVSFAMMGVLLGSSYALDSSAHRLKTKPGGKEITHRHRSDGTVVRRSIRRPIRQKTPRARLKAKRIRLANSLGVISHRSVKVIVDRARDRGKVRLSSSRKKMVRTLKQIRSQAIQLKKNLRHGRGSVKATKKLKRLRNRLNRLVNSSRTSRELNRNVRRINLLVTQLSSGIR